MSYQEEYQQKLTTADEAVKAVQSGMWVDYGWCACTANALDQAAGKAAPGAERTSISAAEF